MCKTSYEVTVIRRFCNLSDLYGVAEGSFRSFQVASSARPRVGGESASRAGLTPGFSRFHAATLASEFVLEEVLNLTAFRIPGVSVGGGVGRLERLHV